MLKCVPVSQICLPEALSLIREVCLLIQHIFCLIVIKCTRSVSQNCPYLMLSVTEFTIATFLVICRSVVSFGTVSISGLQFKI